MAHRYNCLTDRVEPKKNASERTWSRWRVYHNTETPQDELRLSKLQETKDKISEFKEKMKAKIVGRGS